MTLPIFDFTQASPSYPPFAKWAMDTGDAHPFDTVLETIDKDWDKGSVFKLCHTEDGVPRVVAKIYVPTVIREQPIVVGRLIDTLFRNATLAPGQQLHVGLLACATPPDFLHTPTIAGSIQ